MTLPAERIRALAVLHDVVIGAGWRCVLIGGSVSEVLLSSGGPNRATFDADMIVSTPTWNDYEALRRALEARGFRRGEPHQMFSSDDVEIDLIPFGAGVVDGHQIAWPNGWRMSALGLAEALETAQPATIEGTFALEVVPESAFVLLKLISYQDRPEERRRDAADIIVICERHELDSDRRYDVVGEMVDGEAVSFDLAGAFVLGKDVSAIAHAESIEAAGRFFARIPDHYATPVRHVLMEERRTFLDDDRRQQIFRLFRVLQSGMGLDPSRAT